MKKQLGITITLAICLLSSGAAIADDAVWGALLGGGAGAVVGRQIGGRDGTIIGGALGAAAGAAIGSERGHGRVQYVAPPVSAVYYTAPPAYYAASPAYYPQPPVYYTRPVRVERGPIYYVPGGYERDYRRHHDHREGNWNHRGRDWDDRGWDGRR